MTSKNSFKPSSYILLTIVIVVLLPVQTVAWGNKGHQVIARIAMTRLSPSAREAIAQLLGEQNQQSQKADTGPGATLESVSTWADQIKSQRPETKSWHFVAIPLSGSRYSRLKDCGKAETCIIDAIGQQITILKDNNRDSTERAEALKFLVHLIGDLHQPFHVTTNTNPQDQAGYLVRVTSLSGRSTRLLEVWDNDLVEYDLRQYKSVADYAAQIIKKDSGVSTNKSKQGSFISTQGSVTDWALEAHSLAWGAYYHTNGEFMVADQNRSWQLDQRYYDRNVPVVEGQLVRAGVRLAKILNDIFGVKSPY
ncbi:MAG: S1/P1 nuclease [bacterium]